MLTTKDIIDIYSSGVDLILRRKSHPLHFKGFWEPKELTANIYLPCIEDKKDFLLTIFHELIHARDDWVQDKFFSGIRSNFVTEKEARETYNLNASLFNFIKDIYQLRPPKRLK